MAQSANRASALGMVDQRLVLAGGDLLEPTEQVIVGGQLIDAAATCRTNVEVGRDLSPLIRGELAQ
jgi:hypothetical protein